MSDAIVYRDEHYGVLTLVKLAGDRIGLQEHNFSARHLEYVLTLLDENGKDAWSSERPNLGQWVLREHADVTLARVASVLRRIGFENDRLAERAFFSLPEAEALALDAPVPGTASLASAATEVVRNLLHESLGDQAPAVVGVHAFPRHPAPPARTPFIRACAILEYAGDHPTLERAARGRLLERLGPALVRATLKRAPGAMFSMLEVGIRPSSALLESLAGTPLPGFQDAPPAVRGVRFALGVPITPGALQALQERARKAHAVQTLELKEGGLLALVPATGPGDYLADPALRDRTAWLSEALAPWRPSLEEITDTI